MTLLALQRRMATAVMQPLTADGRMRATTPRGTSAHDEAAAFIKPNPLLSSFDRLEIYNQQYWMRLTSTLQEDFPALAAVLGQRAFAKLTCAYLEEHPSRSFTLRNLGSQLVPWLREHPAYAGSRFALALDVAQLEWAYVEAFDNGQERALTLQDMARLDADSRLSLQPYLRLLHLGHIVDDYVIAAHRAHVSSGAASNAVAAGRRASGGRAGRLLAQGELYLGVHRHENAVYYKRLNHEAYLLLLSLDSHCTLGDALERAFENSAIDEAERPAHVQAWFATWAELGWFCRHRPGAVRNTGKRDTRS